GVFQAAKELSKLAIGVDADQYHEAPGNVLTSVVKGVDVVVVDTIRAVKDGTFKGGKQIFGLKEGGVGIVYDEHNKGLISDEVHQKILTIKDEIIQGKIEVPQTR